MTISYPPAGTVSNPVFTQEQFDRYAKRTADHAAYLCGSALEAFACAADDSTSEEVQAHHFDILAHHASALVYCYQAACLDRRIDEMAVGECVNKLFFGIVGAASSYLRLENEDDYLKHWRSSLKRGGSLVTVLVTLARAGSTSGENLGFMIAALEHLCDAAAKVCAWHMEMVRETHLYSDGQDANVAGGLVTLVLDGLEPLCRRALLEHSAPNAA